MSNIYVDCTFTLHTRGQRGIPRVVRNIVRHSKSMQDVVPVALANGQYFRVEPNSILMRQRIAGKKTQFLYQYLYRIYINAKKLMRATFPFNARKKLGVSKSHGQYRLVKIWNYLRDSIGKIHHYLPPATKSFEQAPLPVRIGANDTLFLVDCVWEYNVDTVLAEVKDSGARLVLLCYDIIPITHPSYNPDSSQKFKPWIDANIKYFDSVIAISRYTVKSLQRYLALVGMQEHVKRIQWKSFRLGSDKEGLPSKGSISGNIKEIVKKNYYITVSAIEPRKNYLAILSAAELLWQSGHEFHLVWVGKWTRDGEKEREYILGHPEYGNKLHVFSAINDSELTILYKSAKALIFASIVEGFGLPIVEAMSDGLPVILSDTSIHREVAGAHALYFNGTDILELAELLWGIENGKMELAQYKEISLSWKESVTKLFDSI